MKNTVLLSLTSFAGLLLILLTGIRTPETTYRYSGNFPAVVHGTFPAAGSPAAASAAREKGAPEQPLSFCLVPVAPSFVSAGFSERLGSAAIYGEPGSMAEEKALSIDGLAPEDTPPLDQGMVNVTGEHAGFRMLPHGEFEKDITIILPYDTALIPLGYSEREIYTYYYNESLKRWMMLKRDSVDMENKLVVSKVNHFTDFVNAIMKTPEMPETQAYTPTSIKDLKLADPLDGFQMIAPPAANNRGTAELSYPLVIPPGRHGLQPDLTVHYSSDGNNSWLGTGWDLPVPAITLDTRWGVPAYDPQLQSEIYLLNGQQLATKDAQLKYKPLPHREAWAARESGDVRFYPRVEGAFQKIIRHGDSPATYWWEVTDKQGMRYFYGKKLGEEQVDSSAVLRDAKGNIAHWCLTEIRDRYENFVLYEYFSDRVAAPGSVCQLYLDKISYTGHGTERGNYTVSFNRTLRSDITTSGRLGVYEAKRYLLQDVKVSYEEEVSRWYFFCYETGAFGKSRLKRIRELAPEFFYTAFTPCDEKFMGTIYEFDYHPLPASLYDATATTISTGSDGMDAKGSVGGLTPQQATSLGSVKSKGWNLGGALTVGFGFDCFLKSLSGGGNLGGGGGKSEGILTLIDLDGDGLPDKVFKSDIDGRLYYRKQLYDAENNTYSFGNKTAVQGAPGFLAEQSKSFSWGLEVQIAILGVGLSASYNQSTTRSSTQTYFSDMDADGLPDIVNKGLVYYNRLQNGVPYFTPLNVGDTIWVGGSCGGPVSLGNGVDPDFFRTGDTVTVCYTVPYPAGDSVPPILAKYLPEPDTLLPPQPVAMDTTYNADGSMTICYTIITMGHEDADFAPDHDAVRMWIAPYTGTVTIGGTAFLSADLMEARRESRILDGIRVSVQKGGELLTAAVLRPQGDHSFSPQLTGIPVTRGERLYFRLESGESRMFDKVAWSPEIRYTYYNPSPGFVAPRTVSAAEADALLDANGKKVFVFKASEDFLVSKGDAVIMPFNGIVKIKNKLTVSKPLSETITVTIICFNSILHSLTIPKGTTYSQEFEIPHNPVLRGWNINCIVSSQQGNVDMSAVRWIPEIIYVHTTQEGVELQDEITGEPTVVYKPTPLYAQYGLARYASTKWSPPANGNYAIVPQITMLFAGQGVLKFSVKNSSGIIYQQNFTVSNGSVSITPFPTLTLYQNETYWFDFHTSDPLLADAIRSTSCLVGGNSVPAGLYSNFGAGSNIFGCLYRGWGQFTYKRAGQHEATIIESRLRLSDQVTDNQLNYEGLTWDDIDTVNLETSLPALGCYDPLQDNFLVMQPDNKLNLWRGYGSITYVTADTLSNNLPGDDEADETASPVPVVPVGMTVLAVKKSSFNKNRNWNVNASAWDGNNPDESSAVSGGYNRNKGYTALSSDFMDMNGDRYPDVVSPSRILFSQPQGGLSTRVEGVDVNFSGLDSNTFSANGGSVGASFPTNRKEVRNDPKAAKSSIGGNTGGGTSNDKEEYTWLDINGDGLPDKVKRGEEVGISLGYSTTRGTYFRGLSRIRENRSVSVNLSASGGGGRKFDLGETSISGGYGKSYSNNQSLYSLMDVNGDGMPDQLYVNPYNNQVRVRYNTGSGFTGEYTLLATGGINSSKANNGNVHAAISMGFTMGMVKITPNLQGGGNWGVNNTMGQLIDMNADGYPDYVTSDNVGEVKVKYNRMGKANLLKSVRSVTRSVYLIDYTLSDNTYDCPQRAWLMSSLKVYDGYTGDGVDTLYTTFTYDSCYYDRYERESYHFRTVKTYQRNVADNAIYRTVTEKYHNDYYKRKGLKYYELLADGQGNRYIEKLFNYKLLYIETGEEQGGEPAWCNGETYPGLVEEWVKYYEGETTAQITTAKNYMYGPYGNVNVYMNQGDITDEDDNLMAIIVYHTDNSDRNLTGIPTGIISGYNDLLHQRETVIDAATGKPLTVRNYYGEAYTDTYAQYDLEYDEYGNVVRYLLPPNSNDERLEYEYWFDDQTHTFPVEIYNASFDYSSYAGYNYLCGKPEWTSDINGQVIYYEYDWRGRLVSVKGPNENDYTIKFSYWWTGLGHWDPHPPYGYIDRGLPVASTSHYDPEHPGNPIMTYVICDGLGRPVQTKKESEIGGEELRVASGKMAYDAFGRVTQSYYPVAQPLSEMPVNNVCIQTDGNPPTLFQYDILDRKTRITAPDGSITQFGYGFGADGFEKLCFKTLIRDALGNETAEFVNGRGMKTTVQAPGQTMTRFRYDQMGNLIQSIDPEGNRTSYRYDLGGRKIERNHPDAGITRWEYDPAGNIDRILINDFTGPAIGHPATPAIAYTYHYNRLTGIIYPKNPENNVKYTYGESNSSCNATGRVLTMEDASTFQTFKYGKLGEVLENTRTFALPHDQNSYTFTMKWEYDSWNRIQNITYPDGEKVHYSYDRGGNLKSMRGEKLNEEFHYIQSIDYNTFGARTDIAYGNGTSAHYQYDVMQRLSELTSYTANNTQMQQIVYEYDNVSNITQVTNSAAPVNGLGGQYMNGHYYDNLYRLIYSESYWNNGYGYVFAANYARDGKITHKETYANGNTGQTSSYNFYTYNKREQPHTLRTISDGQQFKWNVNGNLIEHSNSKAFDLRRLCWDQENRLLGVADDKYASIYYYDAAGERTVKITGANEWIDVNGTPQGFAYLNDLTLYTSPYLVANAKGYTKHYYIEGQRVTSKLGGGGLEEIHDLVVSGTEWKEKHRVIGKSVTAITKCLGITKFEYADPLPGYCEVPGRLPLLCKYRERIHPETDLYFYHPDHLGSSSWITDKDGNPIQHLAYMPFGEEFVDQQTSDWSTAYKFSGKEKDVETGYNYFGARYYSSDVSIFISVDPMSDVLPHQSSYVYCSNNPIGRIDPDGMLDGNFYDFDGTLLGNDRKDDQKVYVVTNKNGVTINDNKEVTVNDAQSVTLLPSVEKREEMINELTEFDNNNPHAELGGFYGLDPWTNEEAILWGEAGTSGNPCEIGAKISFDPNTIKKAPLIVLIEFHDHASGKCKSTGATWVQNSSTQDHKVSGQIANGKGSQVRSIVFGMGDKNVYFYNSTGESGKMSFDIFKNLK